MKFVKTFSHLNASDVMIAGGKGASLGEMFQASIPVPDGYVVLASTFENFLHTSGLVAEIEAILGTVQHEITHTVESASEKIQELIRNAEISEEIREEIMQEFTQLDADFVAVRSSATAEDGAEHAWAGQLDSYLNVTSVDVLEKIQHCWASLFTPRAIFYRFQKGLHTTHISVAVVVQKMVNSEKSGIAFSVHPVTEDHNQLIIEAGFGLGEAIVSGQVTPDAYVVQKTPLSILDTTISEQSRGLFRKPNGGNQWIDLGERGSQQVLDKEQIEELSELIIRIENHYGFPCDIEWAYENGHFFIVQSRPITTLSQDVGFQKKIPVSEGIHQFIWEPWLKRLWGAFMLSFSEQSFSLKNIQSAGFTSLSMDAMLFQEGMWHYSQEVFDRMDDDLGVYFETHTMADISYNLVSFKEKSEAKIYELISSDFLLQKKFEEVYSILSTAMTFIWITHSIESYYNKKLQTEVPKYITHDIDTFIGDASFPIKQNLHMMLDDMVREGKTSQEIVEKAGWIKVRDGFSDPYTEKEIEDMRLHVSHSQNHKNVDIPDPLKPLFIEIQELVFFRTERTDVFYYLFFLARPIIREMAHHHNIPFEEMKYYRATSFLGGTPEKYSENVSFGYYHGESIFQDEPILIDTAGDVSDPDVEIRGVIAFRGKIQGTVKIVTHTSQLDKVNVGDILVTQMTFPSFISAMHRASAFVTDEGGITCHAAIVAREMKKPCIIGTKNATKILKDGDFVEVDAESGIVKILTTSGIISQVIGESQNHFLEQSRLVTKNWINIWSGSWSFLSCTDFASALSYEIKILGEVPFPNIRIFINNGKSACWVPENEKDELGKKIVDFYGNRKVLEEVCQSLKVRVDDFLDFFEKVQSDKVGIKNYRNMWDLIVSEYYALHIIVKYIVDYLEPKLLDTFLPLLTEARIYAEPVFQRSEQLMNNWIKEVAQKSKIDAKYISCLTREEFQSALLQQKYPDVGILEQRYLQSVIINVGENQKIYIGNQVENILSEMVDVYKDCIIKGSSVFSGKIQGIVRIIFNPLEDNIFHEGDILVTGMTRPEYIHIVQKAGAIITDAGGILSHVAITARELRKPCIIGTKNATKILKDGDFVEVDADSGTVRKILKKSIFSESVDKKQNYIKAVTRVFSLFEIWMATEVYPHFPIKEEGFNMDTIVLGNNGIIERYLVQEQLDEFKRLAISRDFMPLLTNFRAYEESIIPFFEKDPFENREEFIKIFRQLWIHEITSFFLGQYISDQKVIDLISHLRGTKSAQHIATSEFLPKLYKQVSEVTHIDAELIKYALPEEIISLHLDVTTLATRQKHYVIESIDGKVTLLVGYESLEYSKDFLKNIKNDVDESITDLSGSSAFHGKVRGTVIVITHENDLANVNEGDILVSPMTRTSFLPAMQKAAAYVTDEGGVTCHAAIVARELQKPCVVGTKIASKVLKNGDLVEVDAERGTVKILTRSSMISQVTGESQKYFLEQVQNISWHYWLNRPYTVFLATLVWPGYRQSVFARNGFGAIQSDRFLYQFPSIYYESRFSESGLISIQKYLDHHTVSDISQSLSDLHTRNLTELIMVLSDTSKDVFQKLSLVSDLVQNYVPYLQIILPLETYYNDKINIELPLYFDGDFSKTVGDMSVPIKQNTYTKMLEEIQTGASSDSVVKTYGWMKSRDGFSDFYDEKDINTIREHLEMPNRVKPEIPNDLFVLQGELQELSFFRTDRTDKLYEFIGSLRPIFQEIAKSMNITFQELAQYDAFSIIQGSPKMYNDDFSYALLGDNYFISDTQLVNFTQDVSKEIRGQVAFRGRVRGYVKIVTHSDDIAKVEIGDILVSQMTFPSFIAAMQKAAAFVTDEGSITCHAAIVAREMQKPCIIGTKNVTKILQDGDFVEVDAENGIVRIIEKN